MSATAFQRRRREKAKKELKNKKIELTVAEIKAILKEKGIEFNDKAKKEELLGLLPKE